MTAVTTARSDGNDGPEGARRRRRRAWVLLAIVLVVATALRVWYLPAADRLDSEKPGIENLESMLAGDGIRHYTSAPLSWYPQLLAIRAAAGMHDGGGGGKLHVITKKGRVTRRGVGLARLFSVLYGTAGIALLYLLARRLHTTSVALLATLILCFSPWHIQGSVTFAPEVLVLSLSLLALWLGLRALDRPSVKRLALVGVALGAAAAAGVTGWLVALPVLVGLVVAGRRTLRGALLPLAVALPIALFAWWVSSPGWAQVAEALEVEEATQARRAVREMSSRFTVAVFGFLYPLRDSVHGWLLGTLALLGAVGQAFRCLLLVDPGPARLHRLMVLATAPVLIVGQAWASPLYRDSAFVPLVAFSSLYAAVMLGLLWQGLVALVPQFASKRAAMVAAVLAVALIAPRGWRFVHARAVESTMAVALDWLRQGMPGGAPRLVVAEEAALAGSEESLMDLARGLAVQRVPRLVGAGEERLSRADGEIFLRRELEGPDGAFYRGRHRPPARRKVIAGSALWTRGPDLVAVRHPFGTTGAERISLTVEQRDKSRIADLPPAAGRAGLVSLVLLLPPTSERAPVAPRTRLAGAEVVLAPAGRIDGKPVFVSERLATTSEPRRLKVEPPPWMSARRGELAADLYLWP